MATPETGPGQGDSREPSAPFDALSDRHLAAVRDTVARMGSELREALSLLDQVVTNMQTALDSSLALADAGSPGAQEQVAAAGTIAVSVQALAKQAEQVSAAYTLVSSQSMAEYAAGLQRYVAAIAVSRTA